MTSFTSEGPARLTNDLKPDISAPGSAIEAAAVGTGNEAVALSGTSMAAPHVSGVAVLSASCTRAGARPRSRPC